MLQKLDDYEDWQTIDSLQLTNHSSVILKKKGQSTVVEKNISVTEVNKEYVYLEIQLMNDINSDYVVKFKKHSSSHKKQKIYMDYYSNGDLERYLLKHPNLTFQTKMTMFIDILSALMQLHTRFIIHRDLKLTNIFVDENGRCIVGDLGIASATQSVLSTQVGTFGYQAPDVYSYQHKYDQKVDIWGLGIIAFQMFNPIKNGKLPYPFHTSEQYKDQFGGISYQKYMRFTQKIRPLDSQIPFKLSYLIEKMLKNNLRERIDWIQLYSSDILYELSQDKRLIAMKAEYKCVAETKQILRSYKEFIDGFMHVYYHKLQNLLYLKNYSNCQRDLIKNNWFDLHVFFYLSLKKIMEKYSYFEEKKIYRTLNSLKQKIKDVKYMKEFIQNQLNVWLTSRGEKKLGQNKKILQQQYYHQLEKKINNLLFPQK